ncbi:MAG: sensor histidine kinase [Bdellovibrionia bacterium]
MDQRTPSEQLQATERELTNIRNALDRSAIVAITDPGGRIIHVNDKFCEISKYPRQELLGQNHRIINSGFHPPQFFVDLWKTISSGQIWEGEIRNRAKDGSIYWVYTTIVPFLNEKGTPYEYVSIRYEITSRKQAEEQLIHYADKLEASNRELQDFASVAAHDLQEPLRKIQAFSDRLKTKYRDLLGDDGKDYLDRMLGSAKRMQTLIDDLLSYSRITTKAQPFVSTDLNQVLREVISDLEVRIESTHGKIISSTLHTIDSDPSQMRQLLQNILSNALKFHKPETPPEIHIESEVKAGNCEIRIRDNGIGFEEKYLDRIFTIFQRLHGKSQYEGTGVGLAIVRRIVERHHGQVTAKSTPGHGTTFIINLPVRQR